LQREDSGGELFQNADIVASQTGEREIFTQARRYADAAIDSLYGAAGGVIPRVVFEIGDPLTPIIDITQGASNGEYRQAGISALLAVFRLNKAKKLVPSGAFSIALNGGRHSGFLKNYAGKSARELRSGITSLERQIALHRDKIANPSRYIKNFAQLDPRQQTALLTRKWPSDIQRQQEQLDILRGLLD
jgi:hypothetical protein